MKKGREQSEKIETERRNHGDRKRMGVRRKDWDHVYYKATVVRHALEKRKIVRERKRGESGEQIIKEKDRETGKEERMKRTSAIFVAISEW